VKEPQKNICEFGALSADATACGNSQSEYARLRRQIERLPRGPGQNVALGGDPRQAVGVTVRRLVHSEAKIFSRHVFDTVLSEIR